MTLSLTGQIVLIDIIKDNQHPQLLKVGSLISAITSEWKICSHKALEEA